MSKSDTVQDVVTKESLMRLRVSGALGEGFAGYLEMQARAAAAGLLPQFTPTEMRVLIGTESEPNGRIPSEGGGGSAGIIERAKSLEPVREKLLELADKIGKVGGADYAAALADRDRKAAALAAAEEAHKAADALVGSFDRRVFVDSVRVNLDGEERWVFFRAVPDGQGGMAAEASNVSLDASQIIPSGVYGHFNRGGELVAKMVVTSDGKGFNVVLPSGLGVYDSVTAAGKAAAAALGDKDESELSIRGTIYWRLLSVPSVSDAKAESAGKVAAVPGKGKSKSAGKVEEGSDAA